MNQKELKELIDFLIEKDISEFELERGDVKVRIKRGGESHAISVVPQMMPVPAQPLPARNSTANQGTHASSAQPGATPADAEEELHMVKSPIVGTFYESPSPGSPAFVKVGDVVEVGQVLCIIEAMKLMNEIESDMAGEIVKRTVANSQPVEYGQPLFAIRPRK
ncbi:MAG TPA: acetyl-CoA carboxylase biotin carboxyl carrier protein [Alphaproteobacteria bacterium]|nr:acetyl-CoA carboxylase biotin carboxyl carrier protein [Alphaproteobacteria bacterium]